MTTSLHTQCPCGLPATFESCCGPRLNGQQPADTAEALMRSRYTAFVLRDAPYLLASWHPNTRPAEITFEADQRWLGLKIVSCQQGTLQDSTGVVEFLARYKINGKAHRLRETSRFGRVADCWVYIDGQY